MLSYVSLKTGHALCLCAQVLGLNFRAKSMSIAAAGLTPVHVPGVENANLDTVVRAHTDYAHHMPAILDMLGFNSGA